MDPDQVLESARRLSESLTPGDLDHTLRRITAAAVEVLPAVQMASITVVHSDGRLETFAPTDEMLREVDAAQYEFREGPCYDAATEAVHVTSRDLEHDDRFPRYARVALEHGVRSQAGLRLFTSGKAQGALNLYSTEIGAFEDLGALGALFAHQSAIAIAYAQEVGNLQEALGTRKVIGQAIGIVMERYDLTEERAFAFLTRLSQHHNVKLRALAEELVEAAQARALD